MSVLVTLGAAINYSKPVYILTNEKWYNTFHEAWADLDKIHEAYRLQLFRTCEACEGKGILSVSEEGAVTKCEGFKRGNGKVCRTHIDQPIKDLERLTLLLSQLEPFEDGGHEKCTICRSRQTEIEQILTTQ